jgi:hypothetical protein
MKDNYDDKEEIYKKFIEGHAIELCNEVHKKFIEGHAIVPIGVILEEDYPILQNICKEMNLLFEEFQYYKGDSFKPEHCYLMKIGVKGKKEEISDFCKRFQNECSHLRNLINENLIYNGKVGILEVFWVLQK